MIKNFKYLLLISSVLLIGNNCAHKRDMNVINITFDGRKYDSLVLNIRLANQTNEFITGYSKDRSSWIFTYPDSIYDCMTHLSIEIPGKDTVRHTISFNTIINKDTLGVGSYSFNKRLAKIKSRYSKTDTIPNFLSTNRKTGKISFHTYIIDTYFVSLDTDKELLSSIEGLSSYRYSLFYNDQYTYEENLNRYSELTEKYPDSHYLIARLSTTLTHYKSKSDIAKVFNCFSKENKQSYFGQKIQNYLAATVFENSVLPTWDTNILEPIMKDSTKFNLIIFSASWCAPCHALIPDLKKLYNDLNGKLEITYISIDETGTIDNWTRLMQEKEIPWRSLVAINNLQKIKDKYTVQTIPHLILIQPYNMNAEVIYHQEKNWNNQLYKLVNSQ